MKKSTFYTLPPTPVIPPIHGETMERLVFNEIMRSLASLMYTDSQNVKERRGDEQTCVYSVLNSCDMSVTLPCFNVTTLLNTMIPNADAG